MEGAVAQANEARRGSVLGTATAGDTATAIAAAVAIWAVVTLVPALPQPGRKT